METLFTVDPNALIETHYTTPRLYVPLTDYQKRIAELEAERDQLREQIAEIENTHMAIMREDCPADEIHCTCVPVLRAENKRLRDGYNAAIDVAEQRMFEECVKAVCLLCQEGYPIIEAHGFRHRIPGDLYLCSGANIRLAFPERSARMNAGD